MVGSDASGKSTGSGSSMPKPGRSTGSKSFMPKSGRSTGCGSSMPHLGKATLSSAEWQRTMPSVPHKFQAQSTQHNAAQYEARRMCTPWPCLNMKHILQYIHTHLAVTTFRSVTEDVSTHAQSADKQNTRCAKVTLCRYLALACSVGLTRPGGRLAKSDAGFGPEVVLMSGTSSPRRLAADNTKHPQTPWDYWCRVAVVVHARAWHQPSVHVRQHDAHCPRIPVCMAMRHARAHPTTAAS